MCSGFPNMCPVRVDNDAMGMDDVERVCAVLVMSEVVVVSVFASAGTTLTVANSGIFVNDGIVGTVAKFNCKVDVCGGIKV